MAVTSHYDHQINTILIIHNINVLTLVIMYHSDQIAHELSCGNWIVMRTGDGIERKDSTKSAKNESILY